MTNTKQDAPKIVEYRWLYNLSERCAADAVTEVDALGRELHQPPEGWVPASAYALDECGDAYAIEEPEEYQPGEGFVALAQIEEVRVSDPARAARLALAYLRGDLVSEIGRDDDFEEVFGAWGQTRAEDSFVVRFRGKVSEAYDPGLDVPDHIMDYLAAVLYAGCEPQV